MYAITPIHHPSGLLTSIGGAIAGGARVALASSFDPTTFWAEVRRYGVTIVSYTWCGGKWEPMAVPCPPKPAPAMISSRLMAWAIACRTRESLEEARYTVDWARDGVEALALAREREYAAIILDLMLPGLDGWEVCETLRRRRDPTPILMLTARGALEDRIRGFEIGADDYLTKPFEALELTARLEALRRRARPASGAGRTRYEFDEVVVDARRAEVTRAGRPVELSAKEFHLLCYFLEHRGATLSREELLHEVWGYQNTPSTRTVDVHVAWLRQKLETNPKVPHYIVTVHGLGYKFTG